MLRIAKKMLLYSHIPIWKFIQNNHHSHYTDIRLLIFDWIEHLKQSLYIVKKVYCFVYTQIPHEKCITFWWLIWCLWIYRMFANRMNFSCFLSHDFCLYILALCLVNLVIEYFTFFSFSSPIVHRFRFSRIRFAFLYFKCKPNLSVIFRFNSQLIRQK